jgi:hypothetical protein
MHTHRYGGYLVMTLTVAAGQESQARAFVERLAPSARLTYSVSSTLKFELPSDEVGGGGRGGMRVVARAYAHVCVGLPVRARVFKFVLT